MNRSSAVVAVAVLLMGAPAKAQSWEASGLVGYTPSVDLERVARELEQVAIGGGFSWGAQGARFFSPHWGAEVLWIRQQSALEIETADGSADLFALTADQLHGNAIYRFASADARVQPFVFGGLGATFFRATDVPSETKRSFGFGGGVRYFPWQSIGVRGHFRYKPTMLNDEDAGDFCDPFGFCQGSLQQIELAAGVVLRF